MMAGNRKNEVAASEVSNTVGWLTCATKDDHYTCRGNNVVDTKMQKMKRVMKQDFNNLSNIYINCME